MGVGFWRDRNVYVTGGSSGIGLAAARLLARRGANVYVGGRRRGPLHAAEAELAAIGDSSQRFGHVVHDVGDRAATDDALGALLAEIGALEVVINNAGATHPARFLDTPPEVFDELLRTNVIGAVNTTRAVLPSMLANGGGRLAFVSSMAGFLGVYGYTAYCASKFGLVGFVDALRAEVHEHGIVVTVIHPPDTDTPMLAAENRIKPPETAAISGTVTPLPAGHVAATLVRAIERGRYDVVPGAQAAAVRVLHRHAPGAVRKVMDRSLARYRARSPGPG